MKNISESLILNTKLSQSKILSTTIRQTAKQPQLMTKLPQKNKLKKVSMLINLCYQGALVFAFAFGFMEVAGAQPGIALARAFPSSINVKDFGAKGDGTTDDSNALQAAANEAARLEAQNRTKVGSWRGLIRGTKGTVYPEIYFPEGNYKISKTIIFQQSAFLRGSVNSRIYQIHPEKDLFYFHYSYRYAVENLIFEGGKTQLKFWTGNNWSRLLVRNCVFSKSSDYALECRSFTEKRLTGKEWNKSKPWPPYIVNTDDDNITAIPNTAETLLDWYNSTLLSVEYCHFNQCRKAADVACDTTTLSDCSIVLNPDMESAPFRLGGQIRVYNLRGTGKPNAPIDQFWIETDGNLSLRNVDLDNEGETGIGFIRSSILPGATNRGLRMDDCQVKVAGSKDNALVVIEEGTMPSLISMNNVKETSGRKVQAIRWKGTNPLKLQHLEKQVSVSKVHVIVLGILGENIVSSLPAEMQALKQEPIPNEILKVASVEKIIPEAEDHKTLDIIVAEEHGILCDPTKDQTEAIQKLFDFAGKVKQPLVILPGATTFLLSDTIVLPKRIRIRVAGVSVFKQVNADKDIFRSDDSEFLKVENCDFVGGKNAVSITTKPKSKSFVSFDYCSFFDQSEAGIKCLSTENGLEMLNKTEVLVSNIIFRTGRALITNASRSLLSAFWACNDPRLNDAAFFENRGGDMRVQNMLGNPVLWVACSARKIPSHIKNWPYSRNVRWFDNWGRLYCMDNRFGGECGGMCNVFNKSKDGTVFIDGGITRFHNSASVKAILSAQETPKLTVLRNISTVPTNNIILSADGTLINANDKTLFISGLLHP